MNAIPTKTRIASFSKKVFMFFKFLAGFLKFTLIPRAVKKCTWISYGKRLDSGYTIGARAARFTVDHKLERYTAQIRKI